MKIVKNYIVVISFLLLFSTADAFRLSHFKFGSASVLPFYVERGKKYVILSREEWGSAKGTYDDFGGKRDRGERYPVITAAREFWEEAILDASIGLSLQETQDYIDIKSSNNTEYIIANTTKKGFKSVTYITDFTQYKRLFIQKFYTARSQATKHENREKDRIAIVAWDDFQQAFLNQKNYNDPAYVTAWVINPKTNKKERKKIVLRPYLVMKLHGFMCEYPYLPSENKKIRFYMPQEQLEFYVAREFRRKRYYLQDLCDFIHALYKASGKSFARYMFLPGSSIGPIYAQDYIEVLEIEQEKIEKEIKETSFFNFSTKRKLRERYREGQEILHVLSPYKNKSSYEKECPSYE